MKKLISRLISFVLLTALLLMIAIPYFFKAEITEVLKEKLNEQIEGTVDFADVSVNLFSDFPHLYVNIKDLTIKGSGRYQEDAIYRAESTALSVNLKSVIDKATPYQINQIKLVKPNIVLHIPKVGKPNYDIYASESTAPSDESAAYQIALSEYAIIDGNVTYRDEKSGMIFKTKGLNHSGKGNFSQDQFDLNTENAIQSLSVAVNGIDYAKNWGISGDLNAKVDLTNQAYALVDNVLKINDLDLAYSGQLQQIQDAGYDIDLDFNAPNNSLKSLLSLIPSIYQEDFSSLDASGLTTLSGSVHGIYREGQYPAVDLDIAVQDGKIAYPDLPESITGLNTSLNVKGQHPTWNDLSIDIPTLKMMIGSEQITGRVKIGNAMGNQDIAAIVEGNIDLAYLQKFVSVEGLTRLSGKANTHIELDAKYDDITNQNMDAILFDTQIDATNVEIEYTGYPDITIPRTLISGSPQVLDVSNTAIKMGTSDATIDFNMQNPLAYAIADQEVTADLNVRSNYLDADAFTGSEGNIQEKTASQSTEPTSDNYIENLTLNYSADIREVKYDGTKMSDIKAKGKFDDKNTRVDQLDFNYQGMNFNTDGDLGNVYRYITYGEPTQARYNVTADKIDLNALAESNESEGSDDQGVSGVIPVPKGLGAVINTRINTLIYDDLEIKNVRGALQVADEIASLVGFEGNTLGGKVKIDGDYNTQVISDPQYNFNYDINIMDFQEAFRHSNVFGKLAPIAKYIDGNFNSKSEFSGKIGQDMLPDLNTLNAAGIFQTLNGVILDFPVLDKLGNTLGIKELKRYEIKDSWNKFSVKDGAVNVDPFSFTKDDMNFTVAGNHSLDQVMNYTIKAEIPREKLEKSNVTNVVNSGLDWISTQTASKGISLDVGDYIYLDISVTGTITDPKVKIVPTGSGGRNLKDVAKDKAIEEIDKVKDKVMTRAEAEIERRRKEAEQKVNQEVDKVKTAAKEKLDKEVDRVKEQAKDKVKDVIKEQVVDTLSTVIQDKVGEKAKEVLEDNLGDIIKDERIDDVKDKAKEKLKDLFGKKKDDGN